MVHDFVAVIKGEVERKVEIVSMGSKPNVLEFMRGNKRIFRLRFHTKFCLFCQHFSKSFPAQLQYNLPETSGCIFMIQMSL